jgi:hypothetical protein
MPMTRPKKALFLLILIVGFLGFVETIGAVVYHFALPENHRNSLEAALGMKHEGLNSVVRYRPHPYLNYVGNADYRSPDGKQVHDEIGIRPGEFPRKEKKPGVFRIVALGGSTTYGMYVNDGSMVWCNLVGKALSDVLDL